MQRIEKFMNEEEVPDWASSLKAPHLTPLQPEMPATFEGAKFQWSKSDDDNAFVLGPVDLSFPLGKLSIISGDTGSGKTALLTALLGGTLPYRRDDLISLSHRNGLYRWARSLRQVRTSRCVLLPKSM